ncbi:MAG: GNAT family N-acetyltransferase [Thermoplasmata archaeon]
MKSLEFAPVTPERWRDLEQLFGKSGAYSNCWCMWWRLTASEFSKGTRQGNRERMKAIVASDEVPGILAYADGEPVGWCSVAPREQFGRLERSPKLKRVDDVPVWSVVCFFVAKGYRHKGMMVPLLKAAVEHARRSGATIVEGYPEELERATLSGSAGFMGVASAFRKARFIETVREGNRVIMRHYPEVDTA